MLKNTSQPYEADQPLGAGTSWVALPVLIKVTDQTFGVALETAHGVCNEFHGLGVELTNERVTFGCNPVESERALETTAQFLQSGKDCIVEIYTCLFAKFDNAIPLWEKLAAITRALDLITGFVEDKRSRKNVKIESGARIGIQS